MGGDPAAGPAAPERSWAALAHLSALPGALVTASWAGSTGCLLGPLLVWLATGQGRPYAQAQAREALNFNITVAAVFFVLWLLRLPGWGNVVAAPLMVIVAVAWLVLVIIATTRASQGERYRYPLALRLVE